MDNISKTKLIRKVIRRNRPFFSGHIGTRYNRFDYEIYGISYSPDHYYGDVFKLNIRVFNYEKRFYSLDSPYTKNIPNKLIRCDMNDEWRGFFGLMFDINLMNIEIGTIKHMGLN